MLIKLRSLARKIERAVSRVAARLMTRDMHALGSKNAARIRLFDASACHPSMEDTLRRTQEVIASLLACSGAHARWLHRCVNQVVFVRPTPSPGAFERFTRSILLSCDVGTRYDATAVATILAHEIAHARMASLGIRTSRRNREFRRRVESRCVREQLDAVRRIDPYHYFVPWSCELLQAPDESQLSPSPEHTRVAVQGTYRRIRAERFPGGWHGLLYA